MPVVTRFGERMKNVLWLAMVLLVFGGCFKPSARVEAIDDVDDDLEYDDPVFRKEGEQWLVELTVKNTSKKTLNAQYKINFLDSNKTVVHSIDWLPVIIDSKDTQIIKGTSTHPNAKTCDIKLRKAGTLSN